MAKRVTISRQKLLVKVSLTSAQFALIADIIKEAQRLGDLDLAAAPNTLIFSDYEGAYAVRQKVWHMNPPKGNRGTSKRIWYNVRELLQDACKAFVERPSSDLT